MKTKFTKIIFSGYLVIFTIISISSLGYYLDSINPTIIEDCNRPGAGCMMPDTNSECIQPPSPHKFALWNEERCWWFLYEPLVPFERINFISSFSWDNDSEGVFEKLCDDNKGLWFPDNELWFPNNVQCKFIDYADGKKFEAILESKRNIKISGIHAQHICEIVKFPCPSVPEFDGRYNQSFKKIYVNLYNQDTQYTFRLTNDTISYKICEEDKCESWIEEKITVEYEK